jgi:hypothetical protein
MDEPNIPIRKMSNKEIAISINGSIVGLTIVPKILNSETIK